MLCTKHFSDIVIQYHIMSLKFMFDGILIDTWALKEHAT